MLPAIRAISRVPRVNTSSSGFKLAVGLTGIGLAYVFIARPLIKKFKDSNELRKDQESTIKAAKGKVLKDLTGRPITSANLSTIAVDLHDALSFPVDQARAVRVFRSTPWGYVPQLEKMYLDKYSENLKQKLVDKLSDANWISIKYNFR